MVTLVIFHHVADYDSWKTVFDEHEGVRRGHGQLEHRVFRSVDNPNRVVVHNDFPGEHAARGFMADPSLSAGMKRAGVTDEPWLGLTERIEQKRYAEGTAGVTLPSTSGCATTRSGSRCSTGTRASGAGMAKSSTASTTRSTIGSSSSSTTTSQQSRRLSPSPPIPVYRM